MAREWLKQIRVEQHFTQAALARAAGIKVARYSRIEAGYCDLVDDEVKALADTLKLSANFIRSGGSDHVIPPPEGNPIAPPAETTASALTAEKFPDTPASAPRGLAAAHVPSPLQPSKGGDDLSDPANFTLMPPLEALECGPLTPAEFKNRLQQHMAFAVKVLHTSKVKPRIWVAWRDFNKEAQNHLRGSELVSKPPAPVDQQPAPKLADATSPIQEKPTSGHPQRLRPRGNKNVFGFFVEVAKESLTAEKIASLSELALAAKQQRPELGFMKHFKLIAEAELSPSDFAKIAAEAAQRFSGQVIPPE